MIQIDQIKIAVPEKEYALASAVAKKLKIEKKDILRLTINKKSIDARKKPDIFYVYSVFVEVESKLENKLLSKFSKDNNIHLANIKNFNPHFDCLAYKGQPVVIGAGPAGLFAAYILALNGLNPIVYERGKSVDKRTEDILDFWDTGILNTASNVQFGEGGAGTFSDGKLNTLVNDKNGRNRFVLETFVKFGAPSAILYDGKPHIGTDILSQVIKNMRQEIISLGGEFYFESKIDDFVIENNELKGLMCKGQFVAASDAILAVGHSARDTFYTLKDRNIYMEAKDFAVGFRIEHPQAMISESMYGKAYTELPPAPYKLTSNLSNGRGVYSFCMCPGGYVVNASSEENRLVVNGMSYSKRDSANANSAIVCTVGQKEFDKSNPLAGVEYQRAMEEKAFNLAKGAIPQQLFGDFKEGRVSSSYGDFTSETKGNKAFADLSEIFSREINQSIIDAFQGFGAKIKGFDRYDAILSGIESRTSSPVRISRNQDFQSNIWGIFPCGEGAGYAGGITSAAMDGIKVAEALIAKINRTGI